MITKLPHSSFLAFLNVALVLVACSSSSTTPNEPNAPSNTDDETATTRTGLSFIAPCTAAACGEIPSSSKAEKPQCTPSAGACGWSDPDPNGSVSYRECPASECGPEPDASVCPAGTSFKGAACGSENEGACVWRSACTPPPSTTPCPDPDGCGEMPAIGVICKDGSNGTLECMQFGSKCEWQRSCE